MELATYAPFIEATAMGLGVGMEREWSKKDGEAQTAGSRTFALLALLGCVASSIGPYLAAAALLGVAALLTVGYLRTASEDLGATTETAALLTYVLGSLIYKDATLGVALGVVMVVLLASKEQIHEVTNHWMSGVEMADAIRFFVIAFVILPVLPNRGLGPYGVLNPYRIWLLVVALTGISWLGYISVKVVGESRGAIFSGLAGGFISASATTATLGTASRRAGASRYAYLAGALASSGSTAVQLLLVLGVANPRVLSAIFLPLVVALFLIAAEAIAVVHFSAKGVLAPGDSGLPGPVTKPKRPFSLVPAISLAAILTLVLLASRWASQVFGSTGTLVASVLAGFADAHAPALSAASLAATGAITTHVALVASGLALAANTVTKVVLATVTGGASFGIALLALLLLPALGFGVLLLAHW